MELREWGLRLKGRLAWTRRATGTRLLGAMAMACALAGSASASVVNYDPAPTTSTGWNKCPVGFCLTRAFFEPDSLTTEFRNNPGRIAVIFGAGFYAWNNTNNKSNNPAATTPQGWTLSFGGDPGGTLNVSKATAYYRDVARSAGGADIELAPNAALLKTLSDAVATDNKNAAMGKKDYRITWTQGLYDNYEGAATVPAFYEMDVSGYKANTAGQDPSYCASFPAGCPAPAAAFKFSDDPFLKYFPVGAVQGFFFGNAYLSIESLANKSLIVYDGVDYGWHNYASAVAGGVIPEPSTWALLLVGFGGLGVCLRRRLKVCGDIARNDV